MSNCNKLSDLITMYCDDKITKEEKALVENHIQNCEKCKQKLDAMLKAKEILKNSPQLPVPENMFEDFLKYKENSQKQEKKVVPFYKNYRTYATLAAVFVFAFILKSGLLETDKFMPEQINNQSYQEHTLTAPDNTQKEEIEIKNSAVVNNKPIEEKKAKITEEVGVKNTNVQEKTDETITNEPSGVATASVQDAENTPEIAAFEDSQPEPASAGGGGGSASYARIMPDSEDGKLAEELTQEPQATIFVSEQFLERATELLGDNTYLLYQAEQKLTENEIPFESNFLNLDESKQYKITVTVIHE